MSSTFIQRLFARAHEYGCAPAMVVDRARMIWVRLEHLRGMNSAHLAGLGLEPMLTTSELADYLGVHVQAIYDLPTDGRGPAGLRIGREIRYRVSDVIRWLDGLHEPDAAVAVAGGEA